MIRDIPEAARFIFYDVPAALIGKQIYLWRPKKQIEDRVENVRANMNGPDLEKTIVDLGLKLANFYIMEKLGKDFPGAMESFEQVQHEVVEQKKDNPKILHTVLRSLDYFNNLQHISSHERYKLIGDKLVALYEKIIENTSDPDVLKETAMGLARVADNYNVIEAKGNDYQEFFTHISKTQAKLLFRKNIDLDTVSRAMVLPLKYQHAAEALGENYLPHVKEVIDNLKYRRSIMEDTAYPINKNIAALMEQKAVIRSFSVDEVASYGILSLQGQTSKWLKEKLDVMTYFFEGKEQTTKSAYAKDIQNEVNLRVKKHEEMVLSGKNLTGQDLREHVEDIQLLNETAKKLLIK